MLERLSVFGVKVVYNTNAKSIKAGIRTRLRLECPCNAGNDNVIDTDYVYNCTYSTINELNKSSLIEPIKLKHEVE